jgi:hypothetical protein
MFSSRFFMSFRSAGGESRRFCYCRVNNSNCVRGGLLVADLRPCAFAGGAWALAELDVFAVEVEEVEGPAMSPGETVRI